MLELVEYVTPRGCEVALTTNNVGVSHLGFVVDDIHERYERMVTEGVVFRNPPARITEGVNVGGWVCYLSDLRRHHYRVPRAIAAASDRARHEGARL
jgi:hypothetical protein